MHPHTWVSGAGDRSVHARQALLTRQSRSLVPVFSSTVPFNGTDSAAPFLGDGLRAPAEAGLVEPRYGENTEAASKGLVTM